MTHRIIHATSRDAGPDPDRPSPANAVAAVCLHAGLTAVLLVAALHTGLPLVAAAGLAWLGGACATIALLLASDAAWRNDAQPMTTHTPHHPATAPDL